VGVHRPFETLALGALCCLAILGIGRAAMLSARGIRIIAVDRERTAPEGLADLGFVLGFLAWAWEVVAFTLPLGVHLVPAALRVVVLDAGVAKVLGLLLMATGLVVYGLALHAFGASWRLGIDRDRPGALVTRGIFGRSRNPVYLGLALLAAGEFLVLGRLVLLALAILFVAYFQLLIRREERFLAERYGDAYRAYARAVGRWWTWRPDARRRRHAPPA
jgi:protein-S-isoprenylcysteine O-methyltransferase Ste14